MRYLLLLLIAVAVYANIPSPDKPCIYGTVYYDDIPYEGATVQIRDDYYNYYRTLSLENGYYYFDIPHSGWWLIYCHIHGCQYSILIPINHNGIDPVQVNLYLYPRIYSGINSTSLGNIKAAFK